MDKYNYLYWKERSGINYGWAGFDIKDLENVLRKTCYDLTVNVFKFYYNKMVNHYFWGVKPDIVLPSEMTVNICKVTYSMCNSNVTQYEIRITQMFDTTGKDISLFHKYNGSPEVYIIIGSFYNHQTFENYYVLRKERLPEIDVNFMFEWPLILVLFCLERRQLFPFV